MGFRDTGAVVAHDGSPTAHPGLKVIYAPLIQTVVESFDSAGIQAALTAAPDGSTVVFRPGTYEITATPQFSNKSLHLLGPGAVIRQAADVATLVATGGFNTSKTVSSIALADHLFSSGVTTLTSRITFSGAEHGLVAGDVIKVFSEDVIPGAKPGSGGLERRLGEFAIVGDVDGAQVWTSNRLRETYSTAIKAASLKNHTLTMSGLTFSADPAGDAAGWLFGHIILYAFRQPVIRDTHCRNGYASFLQPTGCYAAKVTDCNIANLKNDPIAGNYGYGVDDKGSAGTVVTGSTFSNCRHGYTTNSSTTLAGNTSPQLYGRTEHAIVSDCTSFGGSNNGFDTHEEAYNITFDNCTSIGERRGQNASGGGFQARSRKTTLRGCKAIDCRVGFQVLEEYADAADGTRLENCIATAAEVAAVRCQLAGTGTRIRNVEIIGGSFDSLGPGLEASGADIAISGGAKFTAARSVTGALFDLTDSNVTVDGVALSLAGSTDTGHTYVNLDAGSSITGRKVDILTGAADVAAWFTAPSGDCAGRINLRDLVADVSDPAVSAGVTGYTIQWAPIPEADSLLVGEEIYDRDRVTSSACLSTSGTLRLAYFTAKKTEPVSQVRVISGGTAGVTPTLCRLVVYSVAGNGDLTEIAATANDTALFATANTRYVKSYAAPWDKVRGRRYALGWLVVTAVTPPTYQGYGISLQSNESGEEPRLSAGLPGQTDIPASIAAGSLAPSPSIPYAVLLP